jgi:hypothetical protein
VWVPVMKSTITSTGYKLWQKMSLYIGQVG